MSFSIAVTAASKQALFLNGTSMTGVFGAAWLGAHYVTKAANILLTKTREGESRAAQIATKVLKVIATIGEVFKFTSLYLSGIGLSLAFATTLSTIPFAPIAALIVGSSCAAVFSLAQSQKSLDKLFQPPLDNGGGAVFSV